MTKQLWGQLCSTPTAVGPTPWNCAQLWAPLGWDLSERQRLYTWDAILWTGCCKGSSGLGSSFFPFFPKMHGKFPQLQSHALWTAWARQQRRKVPRENTRGCVIRGKRRKLASAFTLNGLSILHFLGCLNTSVWLMSMLSIAIINEDTFL